jgi:hypothetical protein
VDLVGIEPTTSSMPFQRMNEHGQISSDMKRHRKAAFMRVSRTFAAFVCDRATLPETARHGQGWQGYDTNHDTRLATPKGGAPCSKWQSTHMPPLAGHFEGSRRRQ